MARNRKNKGAGVLPALGAPATVTPKQRQEQMRQATREKA